MPEKGASRRVATSDYLGISIGLSQILSLVSPVLALHRVRLLLVLHKIQAGRGNALLAKIFSVNLDDLYIQGDKGKLTKVRE